MRPVKKENCRQCHGATAKELASDPKRVGQPIEYLADRLERCRAGEEIGPNTMLMVPHAKDHSDDEIVNITHFIASLQSRGARKTLEFEVTPQLKEINCGREANMCAPAEDEERDPERELF